MSYNIEKIDYIIPAEKPLTPAKQAMRERHELILQVFMEIRRRNVNASRNACIKQTASQLFCGEATVRNIIKGKC